LSGGEFVTLSGTSFDRGMRVFFAEQECQSLSFVNASTLICETPAQPAGLYDVYVEDAARTGDRGAAVI
ncbi:MAG: IPT/TIG domain-containing protein, partial [bacterium]